VSVRDVLVVTRNFPPTNHVSVERAMKLVKYLPEFGWRPTVLTGARPTAGLQEDPALVEQVREAEVLRAAAPEFSLFYGRSSGVAAAFGPAPRVNGGRLAERAVINPRGSWHPKAWLIPDSQAMWYPFAVRAATRRRHVRRWDVVIAMSFPPTAILIAHTVAARLGIPYVADFRDAWTRSPYAPNRAAPLARLEQRLEARMIRDAAAVVTVDATMVNHALARLPLENRPPLFVIPNGYDEDDFAGTLPAALPAFSVVHTGRLRRSVASFWAGLVQALDQRPELRGRLHLWQVGAVDPAAAVDLRNPPDGIVVHQVPQVPHREAISYMLGADLLLVEEVGTILPSKAMQYLRASRPILGLLDGAGIMQDVLQDIPHACLVHRDDVAGIARAIVTRATGPRTPSAPLTDAVRAYSRREIARRYTEVLDAVSERAVAHAPTPGCFDTIHHSP
jgi:glycosyltransferase involved in cell wall biosynthesis